MQQSIYYFLMYFKYRNYNLTFQGKGCDKIVYNLFDNICKIFVTR